MRSWCEREGDMKGTSGGFLLSPFRIRTGARMLWGSVPSGDHVICSHGVRPMKPFKSHGPEAAMTQRCRPLGRCCGHVFLLQCLWETDHCVRLYEALWGSAGLCRALQDSLEFCEALWGSVCLCEALQDSAGFHGALWVSIGFCRALWGSASITSHPLI